MTYEQEAAALGARADADIAMWVGRVELAEAAVVTAQTTIDETHTDLARVQREFDAERIGHRQAIAGLEVTIAAGRAARSARREL